MKVGQLVRLRATKPDDEKAIGAKRVPTEGGIYHFIGCLGEGVPMLLTPYYIRKISMGDLELLDAQEGDEAFNAPQKEPPKLNEEIN